MTTKGSRLSAKQCMEQFDSLVLDIIRKAGEVGITRWELQLRLHSLGTPTPPLPSLRRLQVNGKIEAHGHQWVAKVILRPETN